MNKRIAIIFIMFISIFAAGCGNNQAKNQTLSSPSNSSNNTENTSLSNSKAITQDSGESNTNINYSNYSGTWVTESNLKNDFKYGIVVGINVDNNGNIKGQVSDCTENLTHISNVDIKGKIENNKFTCNFAEDGWEHNGTIKLDFKGNKIILTIKYNPDSSKDNFWGIGEGTFTLINSNTKINRTLNNLKDGGLQVIENQCFSVNLENYGKVKFVSGLKRENSNDNANFYLVDSNNNVLYKFSDFYGNEKGMFNDISAISFIDVNNDGFKDVIVITDYRASGSTSSSFTKISSIYFQKGKEFINNKNFDDKLNKSGNNKDIKSVLKFARG